MTHVEVPKGHTNDITNYPPYCVLQVFCTQQAETTSGVDEHGRWALEEPTNAFVVSERSELLTAASQYPDILLSIKTTWQPIPRNGLFRKICPSEQCIVYLMLS